METCKIYTFDKDYSSEREDVEFQIGEMLNDGKLNVYQALVSDTTIITCF